MKMIRWKKASAQPPAPASRGLSWHQIEMPGGKADAPSLGCCNTLYMSTITISVKLVFLMKSWGKASAQSQGCRKSILNILLPEWINNQDVLVI